MTIVQRRICLETMRRRADRYPFFLNMLAGLYTRGMSQTQRRLWTRIWTRKNKKQSIMGTQARDTGQLTIPKK